MAPPGSVRVEPRFHDRTVTRLSRNPHRTASRTARAGSGSQR